MVKPRLKSYWSRLTRHSGTRSPALVFDHWFNDPGVLVRVEFRSSAGFAEEPNLALVAAALTLALARVQLHGVTHRVIAFTVTDNILVEQPRLSEPLE